MASGNISLSDIIPEVVTTQQHGRQIDLPGESKDYVFLLDVIGERKSKKKTNFTS